MNHKETKSETLRVRIYPSTARKFDGFHDRAEKLLDRELDASPVLRALVIEALDNEGVLEAALNRLKALQES